MKYFTKSFLYYQQGHKSLNVKELYGNSMMLYNSELDLNDVKKYLFEKI